MSIIFGFLDFISQIADFASKSFWNAAATVWALIIPVGIIGASIQSLEKRHILKFKMLLVPVLFFCLTFFYNSLALFKPIKANDVREAMLIRHDLISSALYYGISYGTIAALVGIPVAVIIYIFIRRKYKRVTPNVTN
ncbi:hypothetical protein [Paenibacillus polymyxa]|uniref:hypothetical protein n=1 Tax=Paenibacillus polymyxa TaxID=1406 RepID=UPI0025B6EBB1|nr:hypothetical protein [Paenibacillus polymyxa]MDN4090960.1 hypothetical protein [Paenibacillus polymyxa]